MAQRHERLGQPQQPAEEQGPGLVETERSQVDDLVERGVGGVAERQRPLRQGGQGPVGQRDQELAAGDAEQHLEVVEEAAGVVGGAQLVDLVDADHHPARRGPLGGDLGQEPP